MIVDQDDSRCTLGDRFPEDLARMHERRIEQPARYGDVALETVLRIEYRDVKLFDGKILQTLGENLEDVARPPHWHPFLPLLRRHAASQLEGCMDTNRTSRSYTPHAGKGRYRLRRQQSQRSPTGRKYLLADPDRGSPFRSATKKNSQ
jgi:hypothetical protein